MSRYGLNSLDLFCILCATIICCEIIPNLYCPFFPFLKRSKKRHETYSQIYVIIFHLSTQSFKGILSSPSLLLSIGATLLASPAQTCPSAQAWHACPSQPKGPGPSSGGAGISRAASQQPPCLLSLGLTLQLQPR